MAIQDEVKVMLRQEMDRRGYHNNDARAGLAAIVGGESRFTPQWEVDYRNTDNSRIRRFFGSRVSGLSETQLTALKRDPVAWFNRVYGGEFNIGRTLGNRPGTNDGWTYRGGGINQLTGRGNYEKYGPAVGVDLISHPELINTPRVAAAVAVEYMKDRFRGGNFNDMKAAVGVSIGEPDAEKNRLYALYSQTGEWNFKAPVPIDPDHISPKDVPAAFDAEMADFFSAYDRAAAFLKARGLYAGSIGDFDPGPGFRAGVQAYLRSKMR